MPRRVLTEDEFDAIKAKVMKMAPSGLDEAGFNQWAGSMGRNLIVSEIAEAEQKPAPLIGDPVQRFFGGLADTVAGAVKGTAALVSAFADPTPSGYIKRANIGESIYQGSADQAAKAKQAYREGRYLEAFGHGAGVLPPLTPAAQAGEQIGSGDIAGGLGRGTGQIGLVVGPELVARGTKAAADALKGSNVVPLTKAVASDIFPRTARVARRLSRYHDAATSQPLQNPNAGGRLVAGSPQPSVEEVLADILASDELPAARTLPDTSGGPSVTMSPRAQEAMRAQGASRNVPRGTSGSPTAQGGGVMLGPASKARFLELSRKLILSQAEKQELAHWTRLFKQAASEAGTYYAAVGKKK